MSTETKVNLIRRVVIDPSATSLGPQETDLVLREHATDQIMDYLQQLGEKAVLSADPRMLARFRTPSRVLLHPDGLRHIDTI